MRTNLTAWTSGEIQTLCHLQHMQFLVNSTICHAITSVSCPTSFTHFTSMPIFYTPKSPSFLKFLGNFQNTCVKWNKGNMIFHWLFSSVNFFHSQELLDLVKPMNLNIKLLFGTFKDLSESSLCRRNKE